MTFLGGPPLRHAWRGGGESGVTVMHCRCRGGRRWSRTPSNVTADRPTYRLPPSWEGMALLLMLLRAVHSRLPLVLEGGEVGGGGGYWWLRPCGNDVPGARFGPVCREGLIHATVLLLSASACDRREEWKTSCRALVARRYTAYYWCTIDRELFYAVKGE